MRNMLSISIRDRISVHPLLYEIISLLLLVGIIVFAVKGGLILGLQSSSPIMGVSSGSMTHSDDSWKYYYYRENYDPSEFPFQRGIREGDLVFVKGVDSYEDISVGDVVIWWDGDRELKIIHRIVEINKDRNYIRTKGDAVPQPDDKIPFKNIIGKAVFSIPYLGYPSQAI